MKLPELKIGEHTIKVPIVLGAMGVGVTRSGLASAVTTSGGLGVISGVNLGFNDPDFYTNRLEANLRALKREINLAKDMTKGGLIGVNFMVAMNNYKEHVAVAVKEGIDFIISGAGLPTELPGLVKGSKTKIIPIVSSVKAAQLISKMWDRNHQTAPDAVVIEGIKAGGHLGFSKEDLLEGNFNPKEVIQGVKAALETYEIKYDKKIPVIFAGGIFDGKDIAEAISYGADAVQMATRFVATEECDAHINFKNAYVDADITDAQIIISPVGMPGRALNNPLIDNLSKGIRPKIERCVNCLSTCNPKTTPYCISQALVASVQGDVETGLIFAGENVFKVTEITTVSHLMETLVSEAEQHLID
ncbi:MAG TPA: nitronate monooxygenase [Clostridiales bacterium UBA8960]|nr:nitronate monooxygenase [Clostridiales bacterium UBA8960]